MKRVFQFVLISAFVKKRLTLKMNIQILTLNALRFKFPGYMYVHMKFDACSCIIQGKL